MAEETENGVPTGAPVEDDSTTTSDLREALSRANVSESQLPPTVIEPMPSAAATDIAAPEQPADAQAAAEIPAADDFDAALGGSAAAAAATAAAAPAQAEPSMIQVPADHPMAAFYASTPEPPAFKNNRGIGVLIALLATLAFAVLFAGIIAALLAPSLAPSQFTPQIIEYLLSLAYLVPIGVFLVALILLVVVANRAGWWAYVLGGFLVGVAVWAAAVAGLVFSPDLSGYTRQEGLVNLTELMLFPLPVLAGVAARETTVWFGAWIGARGRKLREKNALALEEYEASLAASDQVTANNN